MVGWGQRTTKAHSCCGCSANTLSAPRWEGCGAPWALREWGGGEGSGDVAEVGEMMKKWGVVGVMKGIPGENVQLAQRSVTPPCPLQRKSQRVVTPKQHTLLSETCDVEALVIIFFFSLEMRKLKQ